MFTKQKVGNSFAVMLAEFFGAGTLTFIFLRMQHSNIGVSYFIAIAAGLALAAATFAFVGKSGAHFNPAVTIGMWVTRQIKTIPAAAYIISQLFGAWVAFELFNYLFTQPVQAIYANQPSWDLHVFTAEALGMLIFSFGWAAALYHARKSRATFAAYVGLAFTVGVLIASVASAGLINPALALGTRFWHIWSGAAWGTYVLGPIVGSIVGFGVYQAMFGHDKVSFDALSVPAVKVASRKTKATKTTAAKKSSKPASKTKKTTASKKRK